MKLTPRLQAIADHIPDHMLVGDVGTDHGYLAAYLVQSNRHIKVIASDINEGPVDNALRTLEENQLGHIIEVRLGGGLEPYVLGELDMAVIAGMGGMLIRDIICESHEKVRHLKSAILQPMTQQAELRRWLCENDFEIYNEIVVREGDKFYEIFSIREGQTSVQDPLSLEIGFQGPGRRSELQDPAVYAAFLSFKANKYIKIIDAIREKGSEESKEALLQAEERLKGIEEVLSNVR